MNTSTKDPLHGITLQAILEALVTHYGWEKLGTMVEIKCFQINPSIKSSLTFLRKTPWAKKQSGKTLFGVKEVTKFYLETARLILRDYQADDWKRVHLYAGDPEFSKYEPWGPNTIEDSQNYVNDLVNQATNPDRYKFDVVICLKENGSLIGGCGIRRESPASFVGNLGWAINPEFQKLGYATEAAQKLIEYGFNQLQLKVIYATCDTRNEASIGVIKKLNMTYAGLLYGEKYIKGEFRDIYRYEIA